MGYMEERLLRKAGLAEPLSFKKKPKPIAKKSAKKLKQEKEEKQTKGDAGTDKYFEYHMANSFPKCENCGMVAEWLKDEGNEFLWRSCQAHVLPKKDSIGGFPSVASNLTNHLVLFPHFGGLCNCHSKFDSSWEVAAKMPIFKKAIDIVNKIYSFIAAEERKYLPEVFTQEIKPEIYNK